MQEFDKMQQHQRQKLKFATLTERVSSKGTRYMTGWLGETEIVAFQGPQTEWGPTWNLFLQERPPKPQHAAQQRPSQQQQQAVDLFQRPLDR
jgi:hypothetical protein